MIGSRAFWDGFARGMASPFLFMSHYLSTVDKMFNPCICERLVGGAIYPHPDCPTHGSEWITVVPKVHRTSS